MLKDGWLMNNMDRESLIDRYLLGRMDASEAAGFEAMMNEDDELREEVEFMKAIKESLERRESNLQQMQRWSAEFREQEARSTAHKTRVRVLQWKTLVSAAACIALFLGLAYPYSYNGLQDREFMAMSARGTLDEVIDLMENDNYQQALDLIDGSIMDLEATLATAKDQNYVLSEIDYLEWARIQTLLKMKDYERAYESVEAFRTDLSEYQKQAYQKKADRLYKKLKLRLRK